MATPAWTYSDWVTKASNDADRLTRLRSHIQEVSDYISTGDESVEGATHQKGYLQTYLDKLHQLEAKERGLLDQVGGKSSTFTRGRAR